MDTVICMIFIVVIHLIKNEIPTLINWRKLDFMNDITGFRLAHMPRSSSCGCMIKASRLPANHFLPFITICTIDHNLYFFFVSGLHKTNSQND